MHGYLILNPYHSCVFFAVARLLSNPSDLQLYVVNHHRTAMKNVPLNSYRNK